MFKVATSLLQPVVGARDEAQPARDQAWSHPAKMGLGICLALTSWLAVGGIIYLFSGI